jgi:hypothetical protein
MANNGSVLGKGRSKIRRNTRRHLRQIEADAASAEQSRRATIRGMRNAGKPKPLHEVKSEGRRARG